MADPYLPLGEPPRDDVDAAARLLIRYEDAGLLGEEFGEMWTMMLGRERAAEVSKRADELRAAAAE